MTIIKKIFLFNTRSLIRSICHIILSQCGLKNTGLKITFNVHVAKNDTCTKKDRKAVNRSAFHGRIQGRLGGSGPTQICIHLLINYSVLVLCDYTLFGYVKRWLGAVS